MQQLQVIVNKLNKRKCPVMDFNDKENITATLKKGDVFESVGAITNKMGKWHFGKDGQFVWEGGLEKAKESFPQSNFISKNIKAKESQVSM